MENEPLVISYLQIRKAVGFLGIFLPIILMLYSYLIGPCNEIQISLSQYYYTSAGNLFTGIICAISFFLFTYKGYHSDNNAPRIASIFGFLTAIFPTNQKGLVCNFEISPYPFPDYFKDVHTVAAALFFVVLAYISIRLFTKSGKKKDQTPEKEIRNKIYKACGYTIIACLILMAILYLNESIKAYLASYKPIFVLETIMLWAFGFSWLVKGEFIFEDKSN
ncbi:MAG: hypothetical protein V4683_14795 [Bacteroidota bacterium]